MVSAPSTGSSATASKSANGAATNGHQSSSAAAPASSSSSKSAQYPVYASHIPISMRKAPALDMATVEVRGTKTAAKDVVKATRPHGLRDAPTFTPTEQEWQDPMEYMRKIAPEGSKYGICKIIPPDSWQPPFAIDTERFHFRTRRQELNSVEGSTRTNLNYLDQLQKFHRQKNGMNLNRFPSVDKRPLDLYKLKKAVESRGGFDSVCKTKKWAEIGRDLGYSGKIMSSLSTSLKNSYQKWLQPYEDYLLKAKPGVQQQLELENGGPYTPSPAQSPVKKAGPSSVTDSPSLIDRVSPAAIAAAFLKNEDDDSTQQAPGAPSQSSGFTPANASAARGGFTPVNRGPSGFQPVNSGQQQQQQLHWEHTNGNRSHTPAKHGSPSDPKLNGSAPSRGLKRTVSSEGLDRSESPVNGEDGGSGRRSKRMRREGGGSGAPTVVGSHMSLMRPLAPSRMGGGGGGGANGAGGSKPKVLEGKPGERCEGCGEKEDPEALTICDSCDFGYHKRCLDMPPKNDSSDWHCPRCLVGTGEFGFEEGGIYSLKQFQEKANNFKRSYFDSKMRVDAVLGRKVPVNEEDVEKEFWRLVESLTETVEVEYGADIHSTTAGSGFPDAEKQPLDPYSTDPWNLNILPLVPGSLFRHIKSDISGMTVPWLYVGMCFSTFCWHNEDHYTYSANYQHFGDTKTWYGIPGEDAHRFEQAMREAVPELFEQQPDLLFQLVTLLPPNQLQKAGVNVYALDQRAGQMVITFPQAYHAGFNHGFNFNEAVNFAPSDWEPFGSAGVERLREFRRQPCFSHDELLMTAASKDTSIKSAMWLGPALQRMRARELQERQAFIERHISFTSSSSSGGKSKAHTHDSCRLWQAPPSSSSSSSQQQQQQQPQAQQQQQQPPPTPAEEEPNSCCILGFGRDEGDLPEEDENNCSQCKTYCYLSRFVCKNSGKVFCLLHAAQVACCDDSEAERYTNKKHEILYRVGHQELEELVEKVDSRARVPKTWQEKLDEELNEKARPSLRRLKTLLNEGERINWELPALPDLKVYVDKCDKWVEEATNFTARKLQNRRKNERVWRREKGGAAAKNNNDAEEKEKEFRRVENLHKLLADADKLSFEDDAVTRLRERAQEVMDFQQSARAALQQPTMRLTEDLEKLMEEGKGFNLDLAEIALLEKVIKQLKWNDRAREMQRTMENVEGMLKLIKEGRELGLPENDKYLVFFQEQRAQGELWETKAKELVSAETIHYQQLEALAAQASNLPVSKEVRADVDAILAKHREANAAVQSIYDKSQDFDFHKRPMYQTARDILNSVSYVSKPSGTSDLEKEVRRHEDWMRRGKKLFGKSNAPLHILKSYMESVKEHNDFCLDLRDKPRMPVEPASREVTPTSENGDVQGNASTRDVFCLCRQPESGMMIECELCREWYHSKCLKIARGKIKTEDKYTCPVCDWRVKIPRDAARPKLEDLMNWQAEIIELPFQPEEEPVIEAIIDKANEFRDFLRPFVNPVTSTPDEVATQRFYLRKIEGAEILLAHETNFLRQELHKWHPVAPDAPPILEVSLSTRKPRPTKMQKMMQQLGVKNPEDLPPKFRTKAHTFKSKMDTPKSKFPQPLQPAPQHSRGSMTPNGQPNSASSTDGRTPSSFRPAATSVSGGTINAPFFAGTISPSTTAAPADITNPSASPFAPWATAGRNGAGHDSTGHSPGGVPHSPIYRPNTPPENGVRTTTTGRPLDQSLFSPGAVSHFGSSGPGGNPSLVSPMREFGRTGSRDGLSAHHSHTNSGGGSSTAHMADLFADFTNDHDDGDADRDSRNEAGEAIEALGFVGGVEVEVDDGTSDGEVGFL